MSNRLPVALAVLACAIPARAGEDELWLSYPGGEGPGRGRKVVLIAAEQEYRSEQSMPMMAKVLSAHHGFDCTVLFAVNEKGEVDPTMPVYPEKGKVLPEVGKASTAQPPAPAQPRTRTITASCTAISSPRTS